jgi:alkylhydroperoxidase family enzyme
MRLSTTNARLHWTLNRLKAMSPLEVAFRLRRKAQISLERVGFGRARPRTPSGHCGKPWVANLPRRFDADRYARAADRILAGVFDVFAFEEISLGFPPRWNVDPKSGIEAPLSFGKELDYRDFDLVGDIKYLWEVNRHLELVTLAQAWHLTGDDRYAHGCRMLLDSWFEQNPYPRGANWCVSLEHGVRLVNWSFAWHLLGGETSPLFAGEDGRAFRDRWLRSVYQHCHFIAHYWSRHSSANNHLLGEASGLFIGSTTWPLWRESERWNRQARTELARGALNQTFQDGVNKEQAVWYHHAVADMMLIAGLVGRENGCDFGVEYWRRLESMLDFIASIMDVGGNVPAIGDADEGVLVRFVPTRHPEVFHSLLATGAVLFGRPELRVKARTFDDKTRWLLGDSAEQAFEALDMSSAKLPVRQEFPDGGYFILGDGFETPQEVRIVADAGPLGYLSIAAHGHADALAFTLSVGGKPILIDPGTFAYHTERRWRRYFRGTSAHNTVAIDGEHQSVFGGNFLWLAHAKAAAETFDISGGTQILRAHQDGYRRLSDPVRHRRTWRYHTDHSRLTITDEILCGGTHSLAIYWHFAPECTVTQRGHTITAERDDVRVVLLCPGGLSPILVSGREKSPLGWYSTGFDVKVPTTTAVFSGKIRGDTMFRSEVRIEQAVSRAEPLLPEDQFLAVFNRRTISG